MFLLNFRNQWKRLRFIHREGFLAPEATQPKPPDQSFRDDFPIQDDLGPSFAFVRDEIAKLLGT